MKDQAMNPYLPSYEYIPDGEPHVFADRVYIFGSHDRFDGTAFCLNDYVCWSAPVDQLADWRYEGVIYHRTRDPLNSKGDQYTFAPDVAQGPDGRYYLFYALNRSTVISVAVCDTPAGEYQFYGHVQYTDGHAYGSKSGEVINFDPGVFVDDDGSIHLFTGFAPPDTYMRTMMEMRKGLFGGCYHVELAQDMLTLKSEPKLVLPGIDHSNGTGFEGHEFYEASSMRKIDGQYDLIYSSVLSHELCYATSDRPDGDFQYRGTIISNGDIGLDGRSEPLNYTGNTHGSIEKINGNWYVFYHRQTNCHQYSRQGCAERIEVLPDGTIPQVEMTSCGLNKGPIKGQGEYEARIACNLLGPEGACESNFEKNPELKHPYFTQSGNDREKDGDQYIANMVDGSWAGFKYFDFKGTSKISVRVRGTGKGKLVIKARLSEASLADIMVDPSDEWTSFTSSFHAPNGMNPLYFIFEGNGSLDFRSFIIS